MHYHTEDPDEFGVFSFPLIFHLSDSSSELTISSLPQYKSTKTELMLDALRRFLESHRGELMEEFIRQDVEWGLTGNE